LKIYISLISLDAMLSSGGLSLDDTPGIATDHGFRGIEILDRHLCGMEGDALRELRRRCLARNCGIVVDAGCDLTVSDRDAANQEIKYLMRVIDQSEILGCDIVRVALGGQRLSVQKLARGRRRPRPGAKRGASRFLSSALTRRLGYLYRSRAANFIRFDDSRFGNTIRALDLILPYAQRCGISLAIENHWGISSKPEWILKILRGVSGANIGTCPDFGNFPSGTNRYEGLEDLAPRALHVQAKCWSFGPGGEERTIDFGRCLGILKASGYVGNIAVEYEGGGDEMSACVKARDLILRNW
jgi:sugar phosphate isomerase/epimerase